MQYEKVCVEIFARFLSSGGLRPVELLWTDGARYPIDRTKFIERAPARVPAVLPIRYTVVIGGRERYLYFEPEKMCWFVEVPV